jgi:regulator of replication initiation timing
MKIFNKQNNKDIVKRIDNLDQKLDLVHKSIARLRIDLPQLIFENVKDIEKMEELYN